MDLEAGDVTVVHRDNVCSCPADRHPALLAAPLESGFHQVDTRSHRADADELEPEVLPGGEEVVPALPHALAAVVRPDLGAGGHELDVLRQGLAAAEVTLRPVGVDRANQLDVRVQLDFVIVPGHATSRY